MGECSDGGRDPQCADGESEIEVTSKEKLLLLTPSFHGYWRSMVKGLERQGLEVVTYEYDLFANFRQKAGNKIKYELPERLGRDGRGRWAVDFTRRALDVLNEANPDRVLVIKGDDLGDLWWETLRERKIPTTLWLYDEVRRTAYGTKGLPDVDSMISYSPGDVSERQDGSMPWLYLPGAYDPEQPCNVKASNEVTFVGARYGERESTMIHLHEQDIPVRVYGREWSHRPWDRIRTWSWQRPDLPSHPDISLADAHGVMAGSLATLNIHHNQDGFTLRTFEANGVGGLQLIDRDDVEEFYEPGVEILTYTSMDELVDHVKHAQADPAWARAVREAGQRRTLADHTFDQRMEKLVKWWG